MLALTNANEQYPAKRQQKGVSKTVGNRGWRSSKSVGKGVNQAKKEPDGFDKPVSRRIWFSFAVV